MYKIIKAKPEHAQQILHYKTTTCYWKEFIEDKKEANIITFYKSAHYLHLEENQLFCRYANKFINI